MCFILLRLLQAERVVLLLDEADDAPHAPLLGRVEVPVVPPVALLEGRELRRQVLLAAPVRLHALGDAPLKNEIRIRERKGKCDI